MTTQRSVFRFQRYNGTKSELFQVVHPKTDGQRVRLQEVAKNCLLFKTLDDSQLIEVIDAMFEKKVESGEFLIKEGDDGDFFYIIEEGKYNAMKEDKETNENKVVFTYVNEGNFGELALLYNMPRAASVQVCQRFKSKIQKQLNLSK